MAQTKWYQLDNAAKIVPSTAGGSDSRVFRITCELVEEVDPEALQGAVTSVSPFQQYFERGDVLVLSRPEQPGSGGDAG